MAREWSIRAYADGDEERIFDLFRAVYPDRGWSLEYWRRSWCWIYKENPAAAGKIWIWLAEHEGRIVGQYAVIPVAMSIAGKNVLGAQSVDTMTHPDYRRQGIFETLARKVYEQAHTDGIHIVYGFPNQSSYPGFVEKLNWFDITTVQIMFKPLNWENALKPKIDNRFLLKLTAIGGSILQKVVYRTQKTPIIKDLAITQTSSFDERVNRFWDKVSQRYPIMVVRDKDYLNWRYVTVPDASYLIYVAEIAGEICGYIVLRYVQEEGVKVSTIFDILAQSEGIAQCLISKAVEHSMQAKADILYYSFWANKPFIRALRRNGFIFRPFTKGRHLCAYSSSPYISKKFLMEPQNWFFQQGDSDQI